ncbi:MAG TPA: deoxyribodipyrimidine photo-lyase, partial [Bacteroidales bacterium]|nr:deoxyribodipyrimidine photo-lyase [Bacteroidales bacterium]
MVHSARITNLKTTQREPGNVIYWMSRDQRLRDNWALLHARDVAKQTGGEFAVVFCLTSDFPGATIRHYTFMLEGLRETAQSIQLLNIPFYLLQGDPVEKLSRFINDHNISHVITDFDPLQIKRSWKEKLIDQLNINLVEVDAHNIVPARFASNKMEYGAYTLRPKIHKHLSEFLEVFPELELQPKTFKFKIQQPDWTSIFKTLKVDRKVPVVDWIHPGEDAALDMLNYFISEKLRYYPEKRNDPNEDGTSNLSPYLHFGQMSAQRIAREVLRTHEKNPGTDSFLEELIVRRELSDNYCLYNEDYDTLANIPEWARITLEEHRNDEREY